VNSDLSAPVISVGHHSLETDSSGLLAPAQVDQWEGRSQDQRKGLSHERREAALREAQEMARAELAKRRRKLGTLTPDQEIALENLLMSTVARVSAVAGRVMESLQPA